MTERGRGAATRTSRRFVVGPSSLEWDEGGLTLRLDERTFPLPGRICGTVRLRPATPCPPSFGLDAAGPHHWWPIAPVARLTVELDRPGVAWEGSGYLDSNWGGVPLETSFVRWDWSRAALADGAAVLYDGVRRDGSTFGLALRFDRAGRVSSIAPPPPVTLPPSPLWRVGRSTRATPPGGAAVRLTLEDTPFYARSVLATHVAGEPAVAVHESLSLDRFALPIVQAMLPFRMPRRAG